MAAVSRLDAYAATHEAHPRNNGCHHQSKSEFSHTLLSVTVPRKIAGVQCQEMSQDWTHAADSFCVFTKITAIRSFRHRLHTYCSAQVDSAFHPPWDCKMSINLMAELWYKSWVACRGDSKVKFPVWRPPGTDRLSVRCPEWTFACGFSIADSTISIIIVLLLFSILHVIIICHFTHSIQTRVENAVGVSHCCHLPDATRQQIDKKNTEKSVTPRLLRILLIALNSTKCRMEYREIQKNGVWAPL